MSYFAEIWSKRYFWMSLVKADLRTRYRRSWLGIGWSLMHPIAMTAVFCVVFCRLFNQDPLSFGPYVLSGLAFWSFLTGVTCEGCLCFFQGEHYIRQHPVPLAIYPLRTTLGMLIHLGLALVVLVVFVWATNGFSNLATLWALLPSLVVLFLFGWSVSFCLGVLNVVFQDTQHLMQVIIQAMFYVTPIFYPAELLRAHNLRWVADYNPLAACLELIRQPVLFGQLPPITAIFMVCLTTLILCCIALLTIKRMEQRLIFYL